MCETVPAQSISSPSIQAQKLDGIGTFRLEGGRVLDQRQALRQLAIGEYAFPVQPDIADAV